MSLVSASFCQTNPAKHYLVRRLSASGPRHSSLLPQGFGSEERRVTDSLLVFNAVMFAAQFFSKDAVTAWGIKVFVLHKQSSLHLSQDSILTWAHCHCFCCMLQSNVAIAAGQWWRLITPSFLHGNIVHLIINSMALNSLGPTVEIISGRPRFLAAYSTAAVAGVTASYLCSPRLSLGSSGKQTQRCSRLLLALLFTASASFPQSISSLA